MGRTDEKQDKAIVLANIEDSKKTWTQRPTEGPLMYGIFNDYLHSVESDTVQQWLKTKDLTKWPKPYNDFNHVVKVAEDFQWQVRKKDYYNQFWSIARQETERQIKQEGNLFAETVHMMKHIVFNSVHKKLLRGDEMSFKEIESFMSLMINSKILIDDLEARREERRSFDNLPQNKLKDLLGQLQAVDDGEDE
jgi:hypothetical protein